jgi:hypothetical protein
VWVGKYFKKRCSLWYFWIISMNHCSDCLKSDLFQPFNTFGAKRRRSSFCCFPALGQMT